MYKINRKFNPDKEFFGFKMRTRLRFYDEKTIKQCLGGDPYRIPKNPKVVIDVGGNIGTVALMAAKKGANDVYSFEPSFENFKVLEYNVRINGFQDKIHCINKGVGKPDKKAKLYIHPSMSGAHSTYLTQKRLNGDCYEKVEIISIKDVFKNYNIEYCDLLKLDCEGSEYDIIMDFDDELADKIGQISLEFHDKKTIQFLINKLSSWYEPENTKRYEWVFIKKI